MELTSPMSPALAGRFFTTAPPGKPKILTNPWEIKFSQFYRQGAVLVCVLFFVCLFLFVCFLISGSCFDQNTLLGCTHLIILYWFPIKLLLLICSLTYTHQIILKVSLTTQTYKIHYKMIRIFFIQSSSVFSP